MSSKRISKDDSSTGIGEHVSPRLLQLHWLPVRWRIKSKHDDDALDTHCKMLSLTEQHGRDNRQLFIVFRPAAN